MAGGKEGPGGLQVCAGIGLVGKGKGLIGSGGGAVLVTEVEKPCGQVGREGMTGIGRRVAVAGQLIPQALQKVDGVTGFGLGCAGEDQRQAVQGWGVGQELSAGFEVGDRVELEEGPGLPAGVAEAVGLGGDLLEACAGGEGLGEGQIEGRFGRTADQLVEGGVQALGEIAQGVA